VEVKQFEIKFKKTIKNVFLRILLLRLIFTSNFNVYMYAYFHKYVIIVIQDIELEYHVGKTENNTLS